MGTFTPSLTNYTPSHTHTHTFMFSGWAELRRAAVAAARARAAFRRSSPVGPSGLRAASNRAALANSVRLVEL